MSALHTTSPIHERRPRRPQPIKAAASALLAMLIVLCASGCQTQYHDYAAFVKEPRPLVTSTEYRMAPPDVVLIASKRVREINGHEEQIRSDGRMTLPLLGSVYVAGKTPEQLAAELEKMARDYYDDADVSVRVTGYNSKRLFIFGQVALPGPYPYDGANTVLGTLARAQPTPLADPQRILVLRPNTKGELVRRMTIDLNQMIREGDLALNVVLEEGDIIYIPPNPLAAVGMAFQQVLLPIQPAASTVRGPASIYDTGSGSAVYGGNSSQKGVH
ncbi:MAG: polysaccharide export protein [Planctomycetes bacterium]|nr:polysaccharide export protein [Planctomycetota bacterium]